MVKALIHNELILAIDFDGTITTEPDIGVEPLVMQENAKEVLLQMYEDGIKLILWTCRTGQHMDEALKFLQEEGVIHVFSAINDQLPEVLDKYAPEIARKVGADVYFDDKNAMTKVDWKEFEKFIYGGNNL